MDKNNLIYGEKLMKRYEGNPILKPADFDGIEAIFNCGQAMYKGETILICSVSPVGDARPYVQVARSKDGIHFTLDKKPLITTSEKFEKYDTWVIDPRLTYFPEEDMYYIIRPASSNLGTAAILGRTKDFESYEDVEIIALPSNRVPCLFPEKINGKYARLDRPYNAAPPLLPVNFSAHLWYSESPDLIYWGRHRHILEPWAKWNHVKMGPTPPIKTSDGWLEIIHGVSSTPQGHRYSIGAILLDLENPQKVIGKCPFPLIAPDADYEFKGLCPGAIFTCGAIADIDEDRLRIYYSAGDTCLCLATGSLSAVIDACIRGEE